MHKQAGLDNPVPGCLAGTLTPPLMPSSSPTPANTTANSPAALSTAGTSHHQGIITADVQLLKQMYHLSAGFQITWSLLSLMQEMQRLQQRENSAGVPAQISPSLLGFLQVQFSASTAAEPREGNQKWDSSQASCTEHSCYSCGQPANLQTCHSFQILDHKDILIWWF